MQRVVVDHNTRDFYPEFPRQIFVGAQKKVIENVWRTWIQDDPGSMRLTYTADSKQDGYNLSLVVKDPLEFKKVEEALVEHYHVIKTCFVESLKFSDLFPKVDWGVAQRIIDQPANNGAGGE